MQPLLFDDLMRYKFTFNDHSPVSSLDRIKNLKSRLAKHFTPDEAPALSPFEIQQFSEASQNLQPSVHCMSPPTPVEAN